MDFAGYNDDDGGGDRFDEAPEQNWLCHGCGFKSHALMPSCEVCALQRGARPPALEDDGGTDSLEMLFASASSCRDDTFFIDFSMTRSICLTKSIHHHEGCT